VFSKKAFLRFCTVGMGNTLVDCSLFFLLTLGQAPYLLAQVLAYSTGMVNSFVLNRQWTFKVEGSSNIGEIIRFIIINVISLAFTSIILFALYDVSHTTLWLAKLIATSAGIIVNFTGTSIWVFAYKRDICGRGRGIV
jgi:putative flippase GtrA